LIASKPAALIPTKRADGSKPVHDPVVKSWSRVPTAITTSAAAARSFAPSQPVTPTGPAFNGCEASSDALPATVSTTGTLNASANAQLGLGARVVHAAAADDQRPLGGADRSRGALELAEVGTGRGDLTDLHLEELVRVVVRLGLHVLGQREERRAARGRVEHGRHACGSEWMTCSGRVMRSQ
jgi:hypothetical protein